MFEKIIGKPIEKIFNNINNSLDSAIENSDRYIDFNVERELNREAFKMIPKSKGGKPYTKKFENMNKTVNNSTGRKYMPKKMPNLPKISKATKATAEQIDWSKYIV